MLKSWIDRRQKKIVWFCMLETFTELDPGELFCEPFSNASKTWLELQTFEKFLRTQKPRINLYQCARETDFVEKQLGQNFKHIERDVIWIPGFPVYFWKVIDDANNEHSVNIKLTACKILDCVSSFTQERAKVYKKMINASEAWAEKNGYLHYIGEVYGSTFKTCVVSIKTIFNGTD